jgi:uridylate kinase
MEKKRVVIKISGEALGTDHSVFNIDTLNLISQNIKELVSQNYQISIVVGGGNIYRGGRNNIEISRVRADHIGMVATIMNGIMISENLSIQGVDSRIMSSINIERICEPYSHLQASRYLDDKKVVIFVAGTGNPLCTTDSAAILRAIETNSDLVLKATNVDGVYSADPKKDKNAKKFDKISYTEILKNNLHIMDLPSIMMAKEFRLPIKIFNIEDNFSDIINNRGRYTLILEE